MDYTKRLLSTPRATSVTPSVARGVGPKIISSFVIPVSFILASMTAPLQAAEEDAAVATNAGQAMYESVCVVCHQPKKAGQKHGGGQGEGKEGGHKAKKGHTNRLAPPMGMVKKHYIEAYPERDVFVEKVAAWVAAPNKDAAMLGHAVERFGLMAPQGIDEASRRQIAEYIYDNVAVGQCKKGGGKKRKGHDDKAGAHDEAKGEGKGKDKGGKCSH